MNVCIATAMINGLNEQPYYFDSKCFWAWSIMFSDTSTFGFDNLPYIFLSENSKEEAERELNKLKKYFSDARIHDGDRVVIMIEEDASIRAIKSIGPLDSWIDVQDKFCIKTFKELNVFVESLSVY